MDVVVRRARGSSAFSTLETAILMPTTIFIVFFMVQLGLFWHTSNVVGAAAEAGVDAGQVDGGSRAEAIARAQLLMGAASTPEPPIIDAQINGNLMTVTVSAKSPQIVGVGSWEIRSVAEGRIEEFVPATER